MTRAAGRSSAVPAWLFVRVLGVVYLAAFASLWTQVSGLVGPRGILPAARFGEAGLQLLCASGTALSLVLIAGAIPAFTLAALFALWLALVTAGQTFLAYQWDSLLLQAGFLAIFLVPPLAVRPRGPSFDPPGAAVLLLRLLLFELMLSSALVKLASGEPAWRDLTALRFHYETQPLPTWVGWAAHQLPAPFHAVSGALMLLSEAVVPFFVFGPRRLRLFAFFPLVALQALIAATGNYAHFNLLAAALCLLLLDDEAIPWRRARLRTAGRPARSWPAFVLLPVAAVVLLTTGLHLSETAGAGPEWPRAAYRLSEALAPLRTFNRYGPFAVISTIRNEIVIEGSRDGVTWLAYELPYKPGDPGKPPAFVAPHQPRLDWQLWIAALSWRENNPFVGALLHRLLEGSPPVLRLFARNPFPDGPPRFVRAALYRYEFSSPRTLLADGTWWKRRRLARLYHPAVSLSSFARTIRP